MSVSGTVSPLIYNGNDVITTFNYNWQLLKNTDILVVHVSALGAETPLTLGVDYGVSGVGVVGGGLVTYPLVGSPLPTGERLVLANYPTLTQDLNLAEYSEIPAVELMKALDRLCRQAQMLDEESRRSVKVTMSSGLDPDDLINEIVAAEQYAADAETAKDGAELAQAAAEDAAATLTYASQAENEAGLASDRITSPQGVTQRLDYEQILTLNEQLKAALYI